MTDAAQVRSEGARLQWPDIIKGVAILWIAFFHFFIRYAWQRFPSPVGPHYFGSFMSRCAPASAASGFECLVRAIFVAVAEVGFHAVGVFIVLSGFGLTYSLARTGRPAAGWKQWYRARVLRLYPMYWVAHLVYLISPFAARSEPLDYRFLLSFVGDRVWPIYTIFYYLNPAWWYFSLILELYLVFPFLFRLLLEVGPGWFLALCGLETMLSRYLLLSVLHASGDYVQGAFFGCRLWEFAFGMVLGLRIRQRGKAAEQQFLTWTALAAGAAIYTMGLYSYGSLLTYTVTDALLSTGLFLMLMRVARWSEALPRLSAKLAYVGVYSYGLYLLHQPYVIYAGDRVRRLSIPEAMAVACLLITALTLASIQVEKLTNRLTDRLLGRPGRELQAAARATESKPAERRVI